jgi:hypothetical protein
MKKDTRKFAWSRSEQSNQDSAYTQISEIAEEHGIEVFFSGGEQFVDRIEGAGLKPSNFTVEDFAKWKSRVVDIVMGGLIEAERSAFDELLLAKSPSKNKKTNK